MIKVFYHANCFDGFGAAFACWMALKDKASYTPMHYNDPLPVLDEGDSVFFVDYSRSKEELLELSKNNYVTVIDHHKTAVDQWSEEELKDYALLREKESNLTLIFDMNKSGAGLTWDYFFSKRTDMIDLIEKRDLWKLDDTVDRFHSALCSYPMNFEVWKTISKTPISSFLKEGETILRYQKVLVDKICSQVIWEDINGYKVPIVNTSTLFSEVASKLLDLHPESSFAGYKYYRSNCIQYGLRSRTDFDVSAVAKVMGGGGHKQAAGFEVKL